jgi:DNA primase
VSNDNRMYVRVADWQAQPGYRAGDDADSFIRREGPDAFQRMIDSAKPAGDWIIDQTERDLVEESDIYVIAQTIKGLIEMASKEPDPTIRAHYMRRIASMAQIDESVLLAPVDPRPTWQGPSPITDRPNQSRRGGVRLP